MAILKSVVDVNNGNTGWSKSDVLDALETVFANLGWNNGPAVAGVPCVVKAPGFTGTEYATTTSQYFSGDSLSTTIRVDNFQHCGGPAPTQNQYKTRYFTVSNNGASAYRILEDILFNAVSQVDDTNNTIYDLRHGLETGDLVTYAPGVTSPDPDYVIGGLVANATYYVIKVDDDYFKLASSASNATNGIAIDISPATTSGYNLRRADLPDYDNYTIRVKLGDRLNFDTISVSGVGGNFAILRNSDSYDSEKVINYTSGSFGDPPTGIGTDDIYWDTGGWRQTEDEPLNPRRNIGEGPGTSLDDYGIVKYTYANDTNPDMKGEIILEPFISNNSFSNYSHYWKYTVPALGDRSELKLRVYRGNQNWSSPYIVAITINSIGSGWSDNDSFTISGDQIGGISPENDITFGVNQDESSSGAADGVPSIGVTNLGAGSDLFQKHPLGYYGIARITHDAGKVYGTTYYGFGMNDSNEYYLNVFSGSNWEWLNRPGVHYPYNSTTSTHYGVYDGEQGLDYSGGGYLYRNSNNDFRRIQYASTSTPTAYPLQIRVYRAQAPQDTNFAIIQFAQVINQNIVPYGTFTIAKGSTFGAGIYDLDYVFQDILIDYYTGTTSIISRFGDTGDEYFENLNEPASLETKARGASYGYLRQDLSSEVRLTTEYACNIDTNNSTTADEVVTYYRNSTYDQYNGNAVSPSADYYRPIKGLPISQKVFPVPYYIPDDFALLQVATTPGLISFRVGDTVTISPSEVYEIILPSYSSQQTGLDEVPNNTTLGMLLLARIT